MDSWPQFWDFDTAELDPFGNQRKRHSDRFDLGTVSDIWPFHMTFLENITQYPYWTTYVRNFEADAMIPPRILGRRSIRIPGPERCEVVTVYGPEYHRYVSQTGKHGGPPPLPFIPNSAANWEREQQVLIRSSALDVWARKIEQQDALYQRATELVQTWETRRRKNPLPMAPTRDVRLARLNIALRNAEIEETQAAIEAQHKTQNGLAEAMVETARRVKLVQGMMEDIIKMLQVENFKSAFEYSEAVIKMLTERTPLERFLKARTHVLLGMQGVIRARDHVNAALGIYRSFEAVQLPPIDGKWKTWINEAQEVLNQMDETQLQIARREFDKEQTRIDDSVEAVWLNEQEKAATLCLALLQSKYMPIRAQAHLLLARLPKTVDKVQHAKQAQFRLQKLIEKHPGVRDWGSMLTAAVWVLNPPPPWIALDDLDDHAQQYWLNQADRFLVGDNLSPENQTSQAEALNIYLTFSKSAYLSIRAQCHHKLASIQIASDELFRRLEAFQALEDVQKMQSRNRTDPAWQAILLSIQNILGGADRRDWEVSAALAGRVRTMEQLVRNFSRLGQPPPGLSRAL